MTTLWGLYSLAVRHLVGWVFLTSGLDKALFTGDFRKDLKAYGLPKKHIKVLAWTSPFVELLLAVSLLLGVYWHIGAVVTGIVLAVFASVTVWRVRTGRTGGCGCGGILRRIETPRQHIVVNVFLSVVLVSLLLIETTYAAMVADHFLIAEQTLPMTRLVWVVIIAVPASLAGFALFRFVSRNWPQIMAIARYKAWQRRR